MQPSGTRRHHALCEAVLWNIRLPYPYKTTLYLFVTKRNIPQFSRK